MGLAMELVGCYVTNPGGTLTACTASPGDTLTVRSFAPSATAWIEQLMRGGGTAGVARVRSPMLHDNVQGIRTANAAGQTANLLLQQPSQAITSQDTLVVEQTGGGAETDVAVIGNYYTDLTGASARLFMPGDIEPRVRYVLGYQVACSSSATIGTWTDTLITATQDTLHANTDYAILGYTTDTAVVAVAVKNQDTSNLRVGGPGLVQPIETRDYFEWLSRIMGTPHIPVINSANKGSTYVSVIANTASVTTNVTLFLAELRPA